MQRQQVQQRAGVADAAGAQSTVVTKKSQSQWDGDRDDVLWDQAKLLLDTVKCLKYLSVNEQASFMYSMMFKDRIDR